jgi:hypothetical protein
MSEYIGDFQPGDTLRHKFNFFGPWTGIPATFGGTPTLTVYKDSDTSPSNAGVSLTVGFASVTGLNHVAINTGADGAFYTAGSTFSVVVSGGTVDGNSVVGLVLFEFSISRDSSHAEYLKRTRAVLTGKCTLDEEAGTVTFFDEDGTTPVVVAEVDQLGNRTAVTFP